MDQYAEAYKEEAYELLGKLEADLLEMEEHPDDQDLIAGAFRAMHTIKGSGAMFGFTDIADFTHHLETAFDYVREGKISVTKHLVDLSLSACDLIRQMVDGKTVDTAVTEEVLQTFREMTATNDPSVDTQEPLTADTASEPEEIKTYRILLQPNPELFATGTNPLPLLDELRNLGDCSVIARTDNVLPLNGLDPESCYICWDVVLTTNKGANAINDVFIFVEDVCDITIEVIDYEDCIGDENDDKKLGEILVERGDVSKEDLKDVLNEQKRVGELLVEEKGTEPEAVESALVEQQHVKQVRNRRQEQTAASSIRVPADKLDALVDLVGELVTVQARLSRKSSHQDDPEFITIAEEVERLTGELRDNTMEIRMLPISTTFARFKRLVRDLSSELGKKIDLKTEGGETELDKTVIEQLSDPLVHLIRNSIDHGIEQPDERKRAGKPARGTVRLAAAHRGANVIITIEDDGAGLDSDIIRTKAIERGLISPDAKLPDNELFAQIFAPGFSTAEKVTDVSGRGVGMDVVKRSIEALRGSIEISSQKGESTTITLKLPLTLAIIDGLLVELGNSSYVMPLSAVEECAVFRKDDVEGENNRRMVNLRGEIVPYLRLREMFMEDFEPPAVEQMVIASVNDERVGFVVDDVIGEYQTVIKALGNIRDDAGQEGISGATILGDGAVALILDLPKLIQIGEEENKNDQAKIHS